MALERALGRSKPEIHHSDQGVQYAAMGYVDMLRRAQVKISMAHMSASRRRTRMWGALSAQSKKRRFTYLSMRDTRMPIGRSGASSRRSMPASASVHHWGYLAPMRFELQWQENRSADVI